MSSPIPLEDLLQDALSIWRRAAPHAVPAGVLETVAAAVLERLRASPRAGEHARVLECAQKGDRTAWRQLADDYRHLIDYAAAARTDVSGSCAWLAAAHGEQHAHLPLLVRLLRTPSDLAPPTLQLLREVAAMLPAVADPRLLATGLALDVSVMLEEPAAAAAEAVAKAKERTPSSDFEEFVPEPGTPLARILDEEDVEMATEQRLQVATGELDKHQTLAVRSLVKRGGVARPWPSPDRLASALLREFPWAEPVVDRITADLALSWRLSGRAHRLAPLVLVGPPGTGKSRFAARLADLVAEAGGPPSQGVSMAGMTDNRTLSGTAKGWSTSSPSLPLAVMARTGTANPLLLLDELDKVGGGSVNGSAVDTLLTQLEPTTAAAWLDEGTGLVLDLRSVTWIGTANDWTKIPALLRTRLRRVDFPAPRPGDFDVLLRGCLEDLAREHGQGDVDADLPVLEQPVAAAMRDGFVRGKLSARSLAKLVRRVVEAGAVVEMRAPRH